MQATPTDEARALLRRLGADRTPHPGGTLLAHLERVRIQLALWEARPALQVAGLCHAFYGTDGFPTGLLPLDRRTELASVIGAEAESVVHFYASCDRGATYPHLLEPRFRDRFTGRTYAPDPLLRRDFAELTAANELDLARRDPLFRERWGPELLALLTRFRPLLSQLAWRDTLSVLHAP
ncbi:hypothetical protein M2158_009399 [Streptomyces sp. SAI-144]|uniref:DUF6817 domain-containing protein n=1 Tax=Streptomyces sp. SAI-144 TaxID=2940544 RepID=UPI002474B328|nr:hypothetical protein [Streptomyces sp. SAI-144]MDH6440858.1 hypothetical protein [Streptomyces sp. SAI-144]